MVSVIVPVYNAAAFLRETMDSILNQKFEAFEVIAVDDGSRDESLDILREYERAHSRLKVITGENHGAPHARNLGIEAARGEYAVFFDADDLMEPGALAALCRGAEGCDMAVGSSVVIDEKGEPLSDLRLPLSAGEYTAAENASALMGIDPFPDNKIYSMRLIREKGLRFADVRIGQDVNFYLKFISVCERVRIIGDCVCRYRMVRGSISHRYGLYILDILKSVSDAARFAEKNGAKKELTEEFCNAKIANYSNQLLKYSKFSDKKERKQVFYTLYGEIMKAAEEGAPRLSERSKEAVSRARSVYARRYYYLSDFAFALRKLRGKIN